MFGDTAAPAHKADKLQLKIGVAGVPYLHGFQDSLLQLTSLKAQGCLHDGLLGPERKQDPAINSQG